MSSYTKISKCRICGNTELRMILDLGEQALTGVFPRTKNDQNVTTGPLQLVKCYGPGTCGLVQLRHSYDLGEMYGMNYGYRSGLNKSMVIHLQNKVERILQKVSLNSGDLVVDIGSNDATLLRSYPVLGQILVGVDPTGEKFRSYYPSNIDLVADFFPSVAFNEKYGNRKAKIITSIAMFYDLEDPMSFVHNVYDRLDDQGVWVFEQSYLPMMLEQNSYDTVCHEHIEFYAFKQIKWMLDRAGFKIIDVETNDVNGGSCSFMAAKQSSDYALNTFFIEQLEKSEEALALDELRVYTEFERKIQSGKELLLNFIRNEIKSGHKIFGYGASTKGNVILQYCGITAETVPFIAEVNEDKFGRFTPLSGIPIISEIEAKEKEPDYFLVLPWHFKKFIIEKERQWLADGGRFVFPLPYPHVVDISGEYKIL